MGYIAVLIVVPLFVVAQHTFADGAGKAIRDVLHDTKLRITKGVEAHELHDRNAASDLEKAARHGEETPRTHTGGPNGATASIRADAGAATPTERRPRNRLPAALPPAATSAVSVRIPRHVAVACVSASAASGRARQDRTAASSTARRTTRRKARA